LGGALREPTVRLTPMPQPALEQHPLPDRLAYEVKEKEKLSGYAWIDRDKGTVRIPIDTAMALLSKRAAASSNSHEKGLNP
jgi:hypothetical protein